ncbi:MAG: hypothetical protein DMF25_02595, partial [Verrucomicrobia bacterium]
MESLVKQLGMALAEVRRREAKKKLFASLRTIFTARLHTAWKRSKVSAECVEKINEEYFYVPAHQTIYNVLVDLWNAGQAIDLITFTQVLRDRNLLESVGGAAFVTSLFTFVPTAANVGYYLEIVRDKYILRQIITASTESVRRAYEEQDEVSNLLDEVEQRIFAVGEDRFKGQMLSMKDQVMEAIESIEKLYERK